MATRDTVSRGPKSNGPNPDGPIHNEPASTGRSASVGREAIASALRRVAIIAPSGASLRRNRLGLIRAITTRRHGVMVFAPEFSADDGKALDSIGLERRILPPKPPGLALFAEQRATAALAADLASYRPHAVLTYGDETGLRGARAARKAKVARIVALVNGLPTAGRFGDRACRALARTLQLADLAVFHNPDDPKTLAKASMLPPDLPYTIVPGAGVDLAANSVQPLPALGDGLTFLMIARLDKATGVLDYIAAARSLRARAPTARFLLVGPPGRGATAVQLSGAGADRDGVDYLGPLDDVRPAIARCHVYVYPSHAEGMPRSVLEAMSAGRPVITTQVPGCRDTVDERVNGCLVPPSDPVALGSAMESFLKRPDLIASMARASRGKAERRFDERGVNATIMDALGLT
jgi:glycosyltransferase involved in cell wall biosynthesis